MPINYQYKNMTSGCQPAQCLDENGCPPGVCPDFTIRRHDTRPPFKVLVEDCDGALNVQGLIVEVNMWANAKLKAAITTEDTYFQFADHIGFNQVMIGDIIQMDRVRQPEYMLVTGIDEENKFILVERGYRGTTAGNWKKGNKLRIFRIMNAPAETELLFEDITTPDGTTETDVLTEAYLVYNWRAEDTCLPGCYWLEFKVLKMQDIVLWLPGGLWAGPVHQEADGFFYTGSEQTESSVRLSYDSVNDKYIIPSSAWTGDFNYFSGFYYTGLVINDGSVVLNRNDIPVSNDTVISNISSVEEEVELMALAVSVTPSFVEYPDPTLWNYYFGCVLGEGVEWERRFPVNHEGFLIKITDSFTSE
jgi:hypothetical protein